MSGLCAVMIPISFIRVPEVRDDSLFCLFLQSGQVILNAFDRRIGTPVWYIRWRLNEVPRRFEPRNLTGGFWEWGWEVVGFIGDVRCHLAYLPLWVPTIAFGLWPGIVAVKTMRRRRAQVRGFDVTPAEDTADAA
jgi:hypothetical protein